MAFSPDGRRLVSAAGSFLVALIPQALGSRIHVLAPHRANPSHAIRGPFPTSKEHNQTPCLKNYGDNQTSPGTSPRASGRGLKNKNVDLLAFLQRKGNSAKVAHFVIAANFPGTQCSALNLSGGSAHALIRIAPSPLRRVMLVTADPSVPSACKG